jgi:hypothetical protein
VASYRGHLASVAVLVCASTGCGAPNHSIDTTATARAPSPWPLLKRLPGPPRWDSYDYHRGGRWRRAAIWQVDGDRVQVLPLRRPPDRVDPLPFDAPPELDHRQFAGTRRTVLAVEDGWLVAIDGGEFAMGLYWVEAGSHELHSLDANLSYPIGWVSNGVRESRNIPLAVAGSCHGEGCTHRTTVYELFPALERGWQLSPRAVIQGCPAALTQSADQRALFIASDCGTLSRVNDDRTVRVVAEWPSHLFPYQVIVTEDRDTEVVYYVSFGGALVRFSGAHSEWFAP